MSDRRRRISRLRELHRVGDVGASLGLCEELLRGGDASAAGVILSGLAGSPDAEAMGRRVLRALGDRGWSVDGARRMRLIAMRVRADLREGRAQAAQDRVAAMVSEAEHPLLARCMIGGAAPGSVLVDAGRGRDGLKRRLKVPIRSGVEGGADGLSYGGSRRYASLPVRLVLNWGRGVARGYLLLLLRRAEWTIEVGEGVEGQFAADALERGGREWFEGVMADRAGALGGRRVALMMRMADEWCRGGRCRVSRVRELANDAASGAAYVPLRWQREVLWDVLTGVR